MPKRDARLIVLDMLEAIRKVERYTAGLTFEKFESNEMVADAVVRNLEVIGEAARHIPDKLRAQYGEVAWHRVVGFRNIVIHEYFDVDLGIVWTIATTQLPTLKRVLRSMLADLEQR